ncbi:MAG: threonine synthase [Chloroflexi bacterium]|nr:threonine synthase [Chloroflexota bacterium]
MGGRRRDRSVEYLKGLVCRECGETYDLAPLHVCDLCLGPLEVAYDYAALRRDISREEIERGPQTVWRYRKLLPAGDRPVVDIQTGCTPLLRADNLGRLLGLRNLYVKNDTVNPTFSFKDRPVTVAATMARAFGFTTLACSSTGNLAAAVAAHAAKAQMACVVFIPAGLEPSKVTNIRVYGPSLVALRGNYDDVNRLCAEIADRYGWAFANINLRPYYAEGSKTLAFEVAEQLGWRTPDTVVVPTASGAMFTKIARGFEELVEVGLIPAGRPRMGLAQAAGCSPIVTAHEANTMSIRPVKPSTIAKSLAIGNPADGYYCLKTIRETNGLAGSVTDDEIVDGMQLLARTEGIFAETAGGVSIGVLKKMAEAGVLDPDETIVVYVTGNGLKTPEAVSDVLEAPITIDASMEAFESSLHPRPEPEPALP